MGVSSGHLLVSAALGNDTPVPPVEVVVHVPKLVAKSNDAHESGLKMTG